MPPDVRLDHDIFDMLDKFQHNVEIVLDGLKRISKEIRESKTSNTDTE